MAELKTLKDLEEGWTKAGLLDIGDLRKTAIEHILKIQRVIKENEGRFDLGMKYEEHGGAMIAWIKYFFDIADEDLKK